ncbi:MmgE/PrpD family protein [Halocynthiibacter namhaensis]|uniref:MmgE/PrpD family protein n=1 Tax=Halocynthiibacter namhaensis TaxID=1290553 RepID=UPI00138DE7E7|nr:MmgE/PrpD family protein [Halocynthiibacter namhaensis]
MQMTSVPPRSGAKRPVNVGNLTEWDASEVKADDIKGENHMSAFTDFVLNTKPQDVPDHVRARTADYLLDLIAVAAGAVDMPASRIIRESTARMYGPGTGGNAHMLFDARKVSVAGAALATATQIDALDAHDGYSPSKGHAGCGLIGALLAEVDEMEDLAGDEFLTTLAIGYEVACRAAVSLHETACDYHTSGAWVAIACAAMSVRLKGGSPETLRQAIGIAEYHGPRSQMMREIDNPTMLHDGSGWGAMTGVVSADMAMGGFLGAPAITVEAGEVAHHWNDLGTRWLVMEQNIKLFPICRWVHAPIGAALKLRSEHEIQSADIERIEIHAFHNSTRLSHSMPKGIAEAQYSLCYPVACALKLGRVGPSEITGALFDDAEIARLVGVTDVSECDHCNANFPADRLGRVVLHLKDGRSFDSGISQAPGEASAPISRAGLIEKFHSYADPVLGHDRASKIRTSVFDLQQGGALGDVLRQLRAPA